uniref:Putative secreted protein n=1 Tax=Anopheles triannulatus TaxID=58253 RepID=A0A2M4B7C2_9DIPT
MKTKWMPWRRLLLLQYRPPAYVTAGEPPPFIAPAVTTTDMSVASPSASASLLVKRTSLVIIDGFIAPGLDVPPPAPLNDNSLITGGGPG